MPKRARSNTKTTQKEKRVKLTDEAPITEAAELLTADTGTKVNPATEAAPATMPEDADEIIVSLEAPMPTPEGVAEPAAVQAGGAADFQEEDLFNYDDIDIFPTPPAADDEFNDDTLVGSDDEGEKVKVKEEEVVPTTEVKEEKDAFDIVLNDDTPEEAAATLKTRENEEAKKKRTAEAVLEGSKMCLVQGLEGNFLHVPSLQSSLGLKDIGDNVTVKCNVNGLEFEVSLKVVSVNEHSSAAEEHDEETQNIKEESVLQTREVQPELRIDTAKAQKMLRTAAPLSGGPLPASTLSKVPCKFGANCNKGENCPFDHNSTAVPKQKLCTWVNTVQGCSKGADCLFSHDIAGIMCTKSKLRSTCGNSIKCAFMHEDDKEHEAKDTIPKASLAFELAQKAALARASREASVASPYSESFGSRPVTPTPPFNAPAGPRNAGNLGTLAGQKRGYDGEGEIERQNIQRVRGNNQFPENQQWQQQLDFNQYGNQYGNQHVNQHGNQYGNYVQAGNYQQGRGRGGVRGRGRGRGNSRGNGRGGRGGNNRQNNNNEIGRECYGEQAKNNGGGAQQNAPQGEMKIKGVAANQNNE